MSHISNEFYRAGATILSPEAIQEIKDSRGKIPNAAKVMASKYHISTRRVYDLWHNCARMQQIHHNSYQQKITSIEEPIKKSSEERLKPKSKRKKNIPLVASYSSNVTQPVSNNNSTSCIRQDETLDKKIEQVFNLVRKDGLEIK